MKIIRNYVCLFIFLSIITISYADNCNENQKSIMQLKVEAYEYCIKNIHHTAMDNDAIDCQESVERLFKDSEVKK
jgi:hypothetical protein